MDMTVLKDRVLVRLAPDTPADDLIEELVQTAADRIALRAGADGLPDALASVCVEAVIKLYRRIYFEGVSSEGADTINTSFTDDVLAEYAAEIDLWRASNGVASENEGRTVKFL